MSNKVYENPLTTEEMVQLGKYVTEASQETVYKMADEVKQSAERLKFLLKHANFTGLTSH